PLGMAGHVENSLKINEIGLKILHLFREDDPHVRAVVPRSALIVAEDRVDRESGPFEPLDHLPDRNGPERNLKTMLRDAAPFPFEIPLFERRHSPASVLADRFDEREMPAAIGPPSQLETIAVFLPSRNVGNEVHAEDP